MLGVAPHCASSSLSIVRRRSRGSLPRLPLRLNDFWQFTPPGDGSRSPFDQLAEIVDAVGDRIDVICDGGVARGTHVLKALSVGAKACSGGRLYLYALAAAGQAGVERALENLRAEIERDMKLMGCRSVDQLSRDNLRFR